MATNVAQQVLELTATLLAFADCWDVPIAGTTFGIPNSSGLDDEHPRESIDPEGGLISNG